MNSIFPKTGFFVNLATEIIGIVITIFFVEHLLNKNEKDNWKNVDDVIKHKIMRLINNTISRYRNDFSIDVFAIYHILIKQKGLEETCREYLEFAEKDIVPIIKTKIKEFNEQKWTSFAANNCISSHDFSVLIELYKYRLPAGNIHILYKIQDLLIESTSQFNIAPEYFQNNRKNDNSQKMIVDVSIEEATKNTIEVINIMSVLFESISRTRK